MKIFVINPGSTSTKLALFENEKVIWAAGAHHSSEDLQHFHHVNEQYVSQGFYIPIVGRGRYSY